MEEEDEEAEFRDVKNSRPVEIVKKMAVLLFLVQW